MNDNALHTQHSTFQPFRFSVENQPAGTEYEWLFTENVTNTARLFGEKDALRPFKDAFHDYVIAGDKDALHQKPEGTKAAAHFQFVVPANESVVLDLRLTAESELPIRESGPSFDETFRQRKQEADQFYAEVIPDNVSDDERQISRQANAGLLWTKQFYNYVVEDWLEGDPDHPSSEKRKRGRNSAWPHLFNRDIISMPDKWEYPWYAAWIPRFI